MSAIVVEDLVKVYRPHSPEPVVALDGLSFAVRRGEIFGLLGPNGAGKTTLLRILTTLVRPTSGTASILGHDVVRDSLSVRRNICVVLQDNAVELYLSVEDNLRTYTRFQGVPPADREGRIERALDQFGLRDLRKHKVIDLSGGMKRRVQVAKAFTVDSPIVFLDEATTGMDPINKRATLDAIREQARHGRTILLTTHLLEEAEELCDTIAIIDHGKTAAIGDLQTIKSLSSKVFAISITFATLTDDIVQQLTTLEPLKFERRNNTVIMSLKADHLHALELVAQLTRVQKIVHFEATSATLEDVFFDLVHHPPGRQPTSREGFAS
jgi:ABC-2 type transport system ATP-binding protein